MLRHVSQLRFTRVVWSRALSTPVTESADPIRVGIQKLLMEAQQQQANTAQFDRTADLKRSLATFESRLKEAESCVQDYRECKSDEEMDNAEKAIDQAVGCLVEVLEDMKVSDEKLNTDSFVRRIKELRSNLDT